MDYLFLELIPGGRRKSKAAAFQRDSTEREVGLVDETRGEYRSKMNSQLATKEEKKAYFLHLLQEVYPDRESSVQSLKRGLKEKKKRIKRYFLI
jgi:hypothetical protein